ncbi:hypothetical protein F5887DRAFT_934193 [Amanita rubescens]|nr:hypothetical protein F5887DRAFT_934193 [Amanita rubescens]
MAEAEVSLLESFPSPPTHIPNPPPSAPPALPLPPVPGPSPISDNFLRRSIASYRDSIAIADDRFSISAAPLSDIDDDDDSEPHRKSHHYNESISDIQLPLSDQDDEDDSVNTAIFTPDQIDPMALHLQMRASRSRSESHKQYLRARSISPSRAPRPPQLPPPPLPPSPRPASPDISVLVSKTPRPRRQRSSLFSDTADAIPDSHSLPRRVSDGDIAIERTRRKNRPRPFNTDNAVAFPSKHPNGAEIEKKLERQLEGGDSDSDSSLDLHTPLPRLMVRDGLLSPNSKLLPESERPFSSDFRGSIYSVASNVSTITKSGIMKDVRDTPMRRHRHRDGRLLRGGIGLTTGLGWSDSEDEDAPSPLTRRLSSLNLSRRSSALSVRSTPVSRSFSSSTVLEESGGHDAAVRQRSLTFSPSTKHSTKFTHPPTSWQKRTQTSSRHNSGSAGTKDSLQLSIPEQPEYEIPRTGLGSDSTHHDTLNTPSTASTLSIPTPSTPADEPSPRKPSGIAADKNKTLPPLPAVRKLPSSLSLTSSIPGTRMRTISSTSMPHSPPTQPLPPIPTQNGSTTPRPLKLPEAYRRQSSSQPQTPIHRGGGHDRPPVPVPGVSYSTSGLRPLTTSTSNPALSSSTMPRALPRPPSRLPTADIGKPKPRPRIGSGMVYRTSSYSGFDTPATAGASKLRMPKSLALTSTTGPSSTPRSFSSSLPITRPGALRTPTAIPRTIAS